MTGGPGGSGVKYALLDGPRMQRIVDSIKDPNIEVSSSDYNEARYFDIIGIDPRGINHTTPTLDCFPDSFYRQVWGLQGEAEGLMESSNASFVLKWGRFQSLSESCMSRVAQSSEESIIYHMSTTPVAADIVAIAERLGEWRENEIAAWLASPAGRAAVARKPDSDLQSRKSTLERSKWRRGKEKIFYWGFSYGTFLGSTLAAMYPDRVERFILDAVVSPAAYQSGLNIVNLKHADEVMDQFYESCFHAGLERCSFYRSSSPAEIKTATSDLLSSLKLEPLPVPASAERGPDTITYSDVKLMMRDSLYAPITMFPQMSRILQQLSDGDGGPFADCKAKRGADSMYATRQGGPYHPSIECAQNGTYSPACHRPGEWKPETLAAIWCMDGESMAGVTRREFLDYMEILREQSQVMGDAWGELRLSCIEWNARPKWRFTGKLNNPFVRQKEEEEEEED
jgi:pimeloyl-ACP methyl ester carboxylesterase